MRKRIVGKLKKRKSCLQGRHAVIAIPNKTVIAPDGREMMFIEVINPWER